MIDHSAQEPILIAGPTASGKSALALAIARDHGGVIVNADSQQVYREWRVLTARPSDEDLAEVPHQLYGHLPLGQDYSVGHWINEVRGVLQEIAASGHRPIVVGGTGLYFKALTEGLAPIPPIPTEIRTVSKADLERLGLTAFAQLLSDRDPDTAATIDLSNPRRVLRAWEVLAATGVGLCEWKARTDPPLLSLADATAIVLLPPREELYHRCEDRFDAMMSDGALEEARGVAELGLLRNVPGLTVVGATELFAHLRCELPLDQAVARAKTETRRYAKRQMTWMRNQLLDWLVCDDLNPNRALERLREHV